MGAVPFYWAQARPSSLDSKAPSRRVTGRGFNWRKRKLWESRIVTLAGAALEVCSLADTLHALVIGIVREPVVLPLSSTPRGPHSGTFMSSRD